MIIELGVTIIAFCMLILLTLLLIFGMKMQQIAKSLEEERRKIDTLFFELSSSLKQTTQTLESIENLSVCLKEKIDVVDPLFQSIALVGDVARSRIIEARSELNRSNVEDSSFLSNNKIKPYEIAELFILVVNIWKKLKKRSEI